jgi:hypothetical protein
MRWNDRARFRGSMGLPVLVLKMRPVSCQAEPSSARSAAWAARRVSRASAATPSSRGRSRRPAAVLTGPMRSSPWTRATAASIPAWRCAWPHNPADSYIRCLGRVSHRRLTASAGQLRRLRDYLPVSGCCQAAGPGAHWFGTRARGWVCPGADGCRGECVTVAGAGRRETGAPSGGISEGASPCEEVSGPDGCPQ